MPVNFDDIHFEGEYTRQFLADYWGYQGQQAISRGIFTPSSAPHIILFVTRENDEYQTQYNDELIGSILIMDGEEGHINDQRLLLASANGDSIHLFFRERSRLPFKYLGEVLLIDKDLRIDEPSRFVFKMVDR